MRTYEKMPVWWNNEEIWISYSQEPESCECVSLIADYEITIYSGELECWAGCTICFGYGFPPIPAKDVGIE